MIRRLLAATFPLSSELGNAEEVTDGVYVCTTPRPMPPLFMLTLVTSKSLTKPKLVLFTLGVCVPALSDVT